MHLKLSSSPLRYVLAQIKFTSIENIAEYVPKLQDKIRRDFPHFQEVKIQSVQLKEAQALSAGTLVLWHFMDKDRHVGIILDKQSIVIHTSDYQDCETLLKRWGRVLTCFHEILNISLITQSGLRYINIIENDYTNIDPRLQGFHLKGDVFAAGDFLSRTEMTQKSDQGLIKIQTARASNKKLLGDFKEIFLPLDLLDIGGMLSFEHYKVLNNEFLLLDVDHFKQENADFEMTTVMDSFRQLHEGAYQAFVQAVGSENLKRWE
ncbi:MAG: TIGR04255 family protein [Gammaproteobacteria bacterium]|nr:TIGR04255 family protein [Gammaproteobacteria bacterium]